mgnify:CR=1 FL=1|jgi:hypothetical protein
MGTNSRAPEWGKGVLVGESMKGGGGVFHRVDATLWGEKRRGGTGEMEGLRQSAGKKG